MPSHDSATTHERRPPAPWRRVLSAYFAGRGRRTALMAVHFFIKESPNNFMSHYTWLIVTLATIAAGFRGPGAAPTPASAADSAHAPAEDAALTAWLAEHFWLALAGGTLAYLALLAWNIPGHTIFQHHASAITRGTGRDLRVRVCRQLQQLSLLYHGRENIGRMQSKVIRDVDTIETAANQVLIPLLAAVSGVAVLLATAALFSPEILWLFAAGVPMCWAIDRFFRRPIHHNAQAYRETFEALGSRLQDMIQMIPVTRAHGLEEHELAAAEQRIRTVSDAGIRFDRVVAKFAATTWSSMMATQVLFLASSVLLVRRGSLTVEELVLFNTLFGRITSTFMHLLSVVPLAARIRDAFASVDEILGAPDLEQNLGREAVASVRGDIAFRGVSYAYPGAAALALDGVDLEIRAGESVALVGPSGHGKSTILSLMLGLIRPTSGRILLDGRDMSDLDMRSFRRHVAVVTQQSVFFGGTIRENVAYGHTGVPEPRLVRALELANAWGFVSQLEHGIDTRIGDGGRALSGGQMQRLALARALLRDPRILVLDEPTSALDVEAELAFRRALANVGPGRTVVLVSHSITNARTMDRILVVEHGRIAAAGSHDELMRTENFYSRAMLEIGATAAA